MQCRLFYCIMENEQRGMNTFILAVCGNVDYVYSFPLSPPSRAAWIEIRLRGVKPRTFSGRRLHGRRGLKFFYKRVGFAVTQSPPSRAAWIEITLPLSNVRTAKRRRLHGRRGLKFSLHFYFLLFAKSPPSRAAWIEIERRPVPC